MKIATFLELNKTKNIFLKTNNKEWYSAFIQLSLNKSAGETSQGKPTTQNTAWFLSCKQLNSIPLIAGSLGKTNKIIKMNVYIF